MLMAGPDEKEVEELVDLILEDIED